MNKIRLLFLLILLSKLGYAQEIEFIRFYTDQWEQTTKLKKAFYIQDVKLIEGNLNEVKVFDLHGRLLMQGQFSNLQPLIPNGRFEFYGIDDKYDRCSGNYLNGEIIGEWSIYKNDTVRIVNYDSILPTGFCIDSTEVFTWRDIPSFRNEDPSISFRVFIKEEQFYPPFEKLFKIEGRVIVRFSIDQSGQMCNPEIAVSINKNFDKEAIRIISSSPDWANTKEKCTMFTFPVGFSTE